MRMILPFADLIFLDSMLLIDMRSILHSKVLGMGIIRVIEQIKWKAPDCGWVCLNIDGASKDSDRAGCNGLLRGCQGEWLLGFSKHLGAATAYEAELWGVWEGLRMARDGGFCQVELYLDSVSVMRGI